MTEPADEIEGEEEGGDLYDPRTFGLCEGDIFTPDTDLLGEALEQLGVMPLAYQSRDGQLYVLIACASGFKWTSIESIGPEKAKPSLRTVQ